MKKITAFILVLVFVGSCDSTKKLKIVEAEKQVNALKTENNDLKNRVGALEAFMNDTDKDGVPDYLDTEKNSVAGAMVDKNGKMIDLNNNGVPDDVEQLMNNNISNAANNTSLEPTKTVVKYVKGATKTVKIQSEKLVLPENLMGNIAFNCPSEMREEQTYEVNAMLGALFSKEEIQESLLESINISRKENNESLLTLQDVLTREVNLGYYLNVNLEDGGNKFDIKKINELANPETQSILDLTTGDFVKKTYQWQWNVTPKANTNGVGQLNLLITPLDKNKNAMESRQKKYAIKIHFKQSFFASFWEEMNRNIPWAIGSIIAPIIAFFIGKHKRKDEETSDEV